MTEIKLYKRPLKGLKIFALTIPFVAIGIWMITKEPIGTANYIMGWLCTCFFGLGIPVGLFHTFDRRPQIIITENGIRDRTTKQDEIKWEQIKKAYPLDIYKQKFVSLVVDDTFEMKKNLYKWASKLNEAIGAQKMNLQVSQLKIDEHTMTDFINEIISIEKVNRQAVIKKYFDK
ncbi:MAG: STM3941 family protein [Saprospiraceae bacterium]|nr:STM3941 family protein [Saprospiraceae bacterium]